VQQPRTVVGIDPLVAANERARRAPHQLLSVGWRERHFFDTTQSPSSRALKNDAPAVHAARIRGARGDRVRLDPSSASRESHADTPARWRACRMDSSPCSRCASQTRSRVARVRAIVEKVRPSRDLADAADRATRPFPPHPLPAARRMAQAHVRPRRGRDQERRGVQAALQDHAHVPRPERCAPDPTAGPNSAGSSFPPSVTCQSTFRISDPRSDPPPPGLSDALYHAPPPQA
jgi:hypothetical protein